MKYGIVMLLLFSPMAWSDENLCKDLEKDLLNLEYRIQTAKLDECSAGADSKDFCRPTDTNVDESNPKNHTFRKLTQTFNKAMAQLIIQQGIKAIGQKTEGSHNALAAMDKKKLADAKKYVEILEKNLKKSKMLSAAMTTSVKAEMKDDKVVYNTVTKKPEGSNISFWAKHNFSSDYDEFKTQLKSACYEKPDTVFPDKICKFLTQETTNFDELDKDLIQTLHGYAAAEMQDRTMDQSDPTKDYKKLRQKFLIHDGKESHTPEAFEKKYFGENGLHKQMKEALAAYGEKKNDETAGKVFEIAKKLDPIKVNYNFNNKGPEAPQDGDNVAIQKFYDEKISEPLNKLNVDLTDRIHTDMWKCNAKNLSEQTNNQVKLAKAEINNGLKLAITNLKLSCDQKNAEGKIDYVVCVNKHCGQDYEDGKAATCEHKGLQEGYGDVLSKLNGLNEFKSFNDIYNNEKTGVMACFEKELLAQKEECLKKLQTALNDNNYVDDISKLKANVKAAQENVVNFSNAQPFKKYHFRKNLLLKAMEDKDCYGQKSFKVYSSCGGDLGVDDARKSVLNLISDVGKIELHVDKKYYNFDAEHGGIKYDQAKYYENRQKLIDDCDTADDEELQSSGMSGLCEFFIADEDRRQAALARARAAAEKAKAKQVQITYERKSARKAASRRFWRGAGTGFMQGATLSISPMIAAWAQHDQTKDWRDQQLNWIQYQSDAYNKRMAYWEWAKDNGVMDGTYTSNWGSMYYNTGYDYYSNFQSATAPSIYSTGANPFQLNFTAPPPLATNINTVSPIMPTYNMNSGIQGFNFDV